MHRTRRARPARPVSPVHPRHPAWISRLKARSRDNRGVAIIEAAFVTPVFFILVLGIIEIGLAMNDYLALANSVRAGSRTASALGTEVSADYDTMRVVLREASAIDRANIDSIVIYKASGFGEPPTPTCQGGLSEGGTCNVYGPKEFAMDEDEFGCDPITSPDRHWCPIDRKTSLVDGGTDFVGVWMKMRHPWVTKMFGNVKTLTDSSVIRLEPRTKL